MPERFGSEWSSQQPEKPRKRGEKLKKPGSRKGVAYGLGTAALGLALAVGTIGEKKPGMPAVPVSEPLKAPPSPTREQIRAMRQAFTMQRAERGEGSTGAIEDVQRAATAMPTVIPQFLPNPAKDEISEATEGELKILTDEEARTLFFWDVAYANPADFLRNHLDSLKGLPDVGGILSVINAGARDSDDEKLLFDSLPKISDLDVVSEQELNDLIQKISEMHPGTYLNKLRDADIAGYLPQNSHTILAAMRDDPSILVQAGLSAERNDTDPLTDTIRTAIESMGDAELNHLYNVFTDPQHPDYAKYSAKEKNQIAALLPLMQDGDLTFDDAAKLVQSDTIGYWQKLAHIKNLFGYKTLATQELERVARALINRGEPDDILLKEIENRFSAQEITALTTHADPPTTPTEQAIFDRLSEIVEKKIEAEIDRRP